MLEPLSQLSEEERIHVEITIDTNSKAPTVWEGVTITSWEDVKAVLLSKLGWNQDVDPDHSLTNEEVEAFYTALRNYYETDRADRRVVCRSIMERLMAEGYLPEESRAALTGVMGTSISAWLTKEEIWRIAEDSAVLEIYSLSSSGSTFWDYLDE